jgi:hypothetical protein
MSFTSHLSTIQPRATSRQIRNDSIRRIEIKGIHTRQCLEEYNIPRSRHVIVDKLCGGASRSYKSVTRNHLYKVFSYHSSNNGCNNGLASVISAIGSTLSEVVSSAFDKSKFTVPSAPFSDKERIEGRRRVAQTNSRPIEADGKLKHDKRLITPHALDYIDISPNCELLRFGKACSCGRHL